MSLHDLASSLPLTHITSIAAVVGGMAKSMLKLCAQHTAKFPR